ncbi:ferredoxin [Nocardioides speluncae]|uniref:ferredoxin n=1 Tax=Nocardioides speluncae TaxID=2670337 RepID=UPI000D69CDFB|nr:ferredoxin [Nocardioides speluncae]
MSIDVDLESCIGAGLCVMAAPEVFDQSPDDGRVVVLVDEPTPDQVPAVREAVGLCPTAVLRLRESQESTR